MPAGFSATRFWSLLLVLVVLAVGGLDLAVTLSSWGTDSQEGSDPATTVPGSSFALLFLSVGIAATALLFVVTFARCVIGWRRSQLGDLHGLALPVGVPPRAVGWLLIAANVAAVPVLIAVALSTTTATDARASAALHVLTVGSNAWVVMHFLRPRRWDGRAVEMGELENAA